MLYSGYRLTGVLSTQLVAVTLAVSVGALILVHISTKVKLTWNRRVLWGYVVSASPFAGILLALFLSNQIGIIILTPLAGKEDVGYFAAALRLFDPVTLIPAAIMGAFLPMMSGLHIQSLGKFVRTLRFTMKYMFILAVPLVNFHQHPGAPDYRIPLPRILCSIRPGATNTECRHFFQFLELHQRKRTRGLQSRTGSAQVDVDNCWRPCRGKLNLHSQIFLPGGLLGNFNDPGDLCGYAFCPTNATLPQHGKINADYCSAGALCRHYGPGSLSDAQSIPLPVDGCGTDSLCGDSVCLRFGQTGGI